MPDAALTTSWPTTPPKTAASGDSSAAAVNDSAERTLRASESGLVKSRSATFRDAAEAGAASLSAAAISRSLAASASSHARGSLPASTWKASRAAKPRCSSGGRSNFEKSETRKPPPVPLSGSSAAAASGANESVLGCLTWTTTPPRS